MAKRPSFQFYPADWRSNANLRRCSWGAKGVWMEILGILHDADEYGLIKWSLNDLILAVGAPKSLINELIEKGVLKGCDRGVCEPYIYVPRSGRKNGEPVILVPEQNGPIWYSSRMIRDEYIRKVRGESNRFIDSSMPTPKLAPKVSPKVSPMPPFGESFGDVKGDGSSSSSSKKEKSLQKEKCGRRISEHLSNLQTPEREIFFSAKEKTLFADYLAMRAEAKMKTTSKTIEALQDSLQAIKSAGHDIAELLKKATQSGWRSFDMPTKKELVSKVSSTSELRSTVQPFEPEQPKTETNEGKLFGAIRKKIRSQHPKLHVLQIFEKVNTLIRETRRAATNGHGEPTEIEILTIVAKNLKIDLEACGVVL